MDVLARPHPDLLPSVFASLRRDRAGAESEGGQEKEQHSCARLKLLRLNCNRRFLETSFK